LVNEHADDHVYAIGLARSANVLETRAVGAVDADGGEALLGDGLDVRHDFASGLAAAGAGVGSVGHGPLVTLGNDLAGSTIGRSRRSSYNGGVDWGSGVRWGRVDWLG